MAQRFDKTHGRSTQKVQGTHQERISPSAIALFRKPGGDFRVATWTRCRAQRSRANAFHPEQEIRSLVCFLLKSGHFVHRLLDSLHAREDSWFGRGRRISSVELCLSQLQCSSRRKLSGESPEPGSDRHQRRREFVVPARSLPRPACSNRVHAGTSSARWPTAVTNMRSRLAQCRYRPRPWTAASARITATIRIRNRIRSPHPS